MAKSKFEYVKGFEQNDQLLPNCWIVVRIDGRGFHRFSDTHQFQKPNDDRSLRLMNHCAMCIAKDMSDIVLCYGQSDEYSFVFRKKANLYSRRSSKIVTSVVSLFTSCFVFYWKEYFPFPLQYPPQFDGRAVCYPSDSNLRDYLSWRQVDCHINNLYNTTFWALVQKGGMSTTEANKSLQGTVSEQKHEILFSKYGINYNNEPVMFRKGSVILRKLSSVSNTSTSDKEEPQPKKKMTLGVFHDDIISNQFWKDYPYLLKG